VVDGWHLPCGSVHPLFMPSCSCVCKAYFIHWSMRACLCAHACAPRAVCCAEGLAAKAKKGLAGGTPTRALHYCCLCYPVRRCYTLHATPRLPHHGSSCDTSATWFFHRFWAWFIAGRKPFMHCRFSA